MTSVQMIAVLRQFPDRRGKRHADGPLFVFQLRKGREPRTETRQRILDAMQTARAAA